MGKIFYSAALSPFPMQFTGIHRREQIAARAVTAPRVAQIPELCSPFLTLTETLWQIRGQILAAEAGYCAKIGNIYDH